MDVFSSLFTWANLPYVGAFTIAVVFALLQMTGVLGLLAGSSDHDADHDADHDLDHDADHDHDVDHGAHHDTDHEHGSSFGDKILVDIGVGRVPFSTVWQTFVMTFGITGLAINALVLGPKGNIAPITLAFTIPIATFIAYIVTRTMTRLLGRVLAGTNEEATSRKDLIGSSGTVISSQITNEFGEIRATDPAGRRVHLICRIRNGETTIPAGKEVVIVDYDAETGYIFVAPLDVGLSPDKPRDISSETRVPDIASEPDEPTADDETSRPHRRS